MIKYGSGALFADVVFSVQPSVLIMFVQDSSSARKTMKEECQYMILKRVCASRKLSDEKDKTRGFVTSIFS